VDPRRSLELELFSAYIPISVYIMVRPLGRNGENMAKKRKKVEKALDWILVQVEMTRDLREAADKVAGWDRKTRSQYIRDLILEDVRRRGAFSQKEE